MPIGYAIDPVRQLVLVRAWGALTDDEVAAQGAALAKDQRYGEVWRVLADLLQVTEMHVTAPFVHRYSSPMLETKRAIVARSGVGFGMARMYASVNSTEQSSVAVVKTIADGLDWLDLPPTTPLPELLDATFPTGSVPGKA
ncbi:MAG: hypothetical protein DHS20C21_22600 [Gemmatimonadota bacterium]|nr:MAG: hypothetical protein DHS20C21_22600 [Gemmatimonadota bacterium]